jgi:hypothetical protein
MCFDPFAREKARCSIKLPKESDHHTHAQEESLTSAIQSGMPFQILADTSHIGGERLHPHWSLTFN